MWWIVSLIAFAVLFVVALIATFFLMVATNGIIDLPDAFGVAYLIYTCGLILGASLLAGFLAKRFSETKDQPLWLTGILTTTIISIIVPILMCCLTFGLLAALGFL